MFICKKCKGSFNESLKAVTELTSEGKKFYCVECTIGIATTKPAKKTRKKVAKIDYKRDGK